MKVWGNTANGGAQTSAPTGTGYTTLTSNEKAFAALRNDGSISAWGFSGNGGTGEPTGTGYQMSSATRATFPVFGFIRRLSFHIEMRRNESSTTQWKAARWTVSTMPMSSSGTCKL